MSVYFRTGDRSGVGVSWWFYLLVVAPFQVLYFMFKAVLVAAVWLAAMMVVAGRAVHGRWQRRQATTG